MNLGKTGLFPQGSIHRTDEGEVRMAVGVRSGKVIVDFGEKPVSWFGLDPEQAIQLASALVKHAAKATN